MRRQKRKETGEGVSVLDLANEHMLARGKKDAKKPVVGTGNFKKKVASESLAVHPDQIPEAMEYNRARGVSVEFDKEGRPQFDNSAHFRRYLKVRGMRHYGY
jgi:hypothetical protein